MFGSYGEMGYGGHFFGMFFMIIFWGAVIVLAVFLVKKIMENSSSSSDPSLELLKRRYANGDITKEEYERMRKDIE